MFDAMDRDVLAEEQIEAFFAGAHRNLEFDGVNQDRGEFFELDPGQGLHFPVVAPHWVQNGPDVSISFSITFQTDESLRRQSLHRLNRQIRKLGLRPTPVGTSRWVDATKFSLVKTARWAKRFAGKGDA